MHAIMLSDGYYVEERGGYDWGRADSGTMYYTRAEADDAMARLRCGGRVVDMDE